MHEHILEAVGLDEAVASNAALLRHLELASVRHGIADWANKNELGSLSHIQGRPVKLRRAVYERLARGDQPKPFKFALKTMRL